MMRDTMRHRGPDDAGVWWSADDRVGLAHRRLSIIDLSSAGHQPMSDFSGKTWITFNGEIYNYQSLREELRSLGHFFRTKSDTEVLIVAYREWGLDCLTHINGMFAFCIYDDSLKRLFLSRDRAGEKPLFYHHSSGKFVFASELKALMAEPEFIREIDIDSLNYFLTYGYVPGNKCILKGVHKLCQGEALTYHLDTDDLKSWKYWTLPRQCHNTTSSIDEMIDELENILVDSVRLQMIADVPVGILLSGGIDSSLITAIAARLSSNPIKTFTITFPGYGSYDEGPHARLVSQYFGTDHTELAAKPASFEILPVLAAQFDEPLADSSILPTYLLSQLIRQRATVALSGDGGDELFGGYSHYSWVLRDNRFSHLVPRFLKALMSTFAEKHLTIGLRGRNYLIGLNDELIPYIDMYFDSYSRRCLLSPIVMDKNEFTLSPESYKKRLCSYRETPLCRAMATDFMTYLVDDILAKVDRTSMLNSLEVRAPWLDYRVIEYAFRNVPDSLKATQKERKILPRLLAQRILPKELDLNRKQGFSIPLASWFKGDWGKYIISILSDADPMLFNQKVIQKMISYQHRGYNNVKRLFALTMFELWRRHYLIKS
jgi:asparagine synthase (glutamine-hydrolysing)